MRRTAVTVLCASCLLTTSAWATGFGLREFSASSLGVSYAGAAATANHASTMAFNPALAAGVADFDVSVSANGLFPESDGTYVGKTTPIPSPLSLAPVTLSGPSTPSDIVAQAFVPSFAMRARLSPMFTVGLTVTAPWGMITDYPSNWVGQYYATKSDVKTYNIAPVAAFQPIPELSIGAGLQVQYITGKLYKGIDFGTIGTLAGMPVSALRGIDNGSVVLKANNWEYGYVFGLYWKPRGDVSLGLSYRSKMFHTLEGTETFTLDAAGVGAYLQAHAGMFVNGPASAKFTTPDVVTFGLRWQVDDKWTALVGVDWTDWHVFKQLLIHSANVHQSDDLTVFNYRSTWFGSLGVEYRPDDAWTLRLGTAYDETPTQNQWRTPGIPDSSRIWLSGGVGYRWSQHVDVDLSVAHLFSGHADINLPYSDTGNLYRGTLTGRVNMGVTIVGIEFTYH